MSTQRRVRETALILDFARYRRADDRPALKPFTASAELLSIRHRLDYRASVEIDELANGEHDWSAAVRSRMIRETRYLLDREFGRLRVNRDADVFQVRHRSIDSLIAGLLRCQFNARQLGCPAEAVDVDSRSPTSVRSSARRERRGLGITWGVGDSLNEAESDRIRRRRRKNRRV